MVKRFPPEPSTELSVRTLAAEAPQTSLQAPKRLKMRSSKGRFRHFTPSDEPCSNRPVRRA